MVFFFGILIGAAVGALLGNGNKQTASNQVKSMTEINMSLMNEFALDCSTTLTQDNIINASDGCSISLEDTSLTNTAYVDKRCLLSISNLAQMEATSSEQMNQMAEALVQQLGLGQAEAENLIDSTTILSQDIVNRFTLDCAETLYQKNEITCSGSGNITLKSVTLENLVDIEADCVQDVLNTSEASAEVEKIIGQSSKAKQESKFSALIPAVLGIIALIVIVLIVVKSSTASRSGSKAPIGLIVGVFIFILIFVVIYTKKANKKSKYPSNKTQSGSRKAQPDETA